MTDLDRLLAHRARLTLALNRSISLQTYYNISLAIEHINNTLGV